MMKKRNHDDDFELQEMDKARILVSIIPVILIIVILAVTLVMDRNKKSKTGAEDVQQSMIDYADESTPSDRTVSSNEVADATPNKENAEEREESEVLNKEEGEKDGGMASPTPGQIMDVDKVDYSKVSYNRDEQLKEMMTYCYKG